MINFRMLVDVLRHSGFGPITCVFSSARQPYGSPTPKP